MCPICYHVNPVGRFKGYDNNKIIAKMINVSAELI